MKFIECDGEEYINLEMVDTISLDNISSDWCKPYLIVFSILEKDKYISFKTNSDRDEYLDELFEEEELLETDY